jgi:hypothetical protein
MNLYNCCEGTTKMKENCCRATGDSWPFRQDRTDAKDLHLTNHNAEDTEKKNKEEFGYPLVLRVLCVFLFQPHEKSHTQNGYDF